MNPVHIVSPMRTIQTNMNSTINATMITDGMSDQSSDDDQDFDESDLLSATCTDDISTQLISAGPIGIAAAAAIATAKKRKRPHAFETNPSVRRRQQTRLLRKLRATIDEYTTRVGQQAVVLTCTPGKTQSANAYRVFGSQPLENIIRGRRPDIMTDLDAALANQTPQQHPENPALHELPPLNIDGIPTPVDKMTQAQLRAFIPEMLKYSTGRSKPGWGKPECRPIWWPDDVPWANVRSDVRTDEQKKRVSWTHALRTIVKNCYRHHNRDDLLPDFQDDSALSQVQAVSVHSVHFPHHPIVQTINNPDGTVSVIHIDTGETTTPQVITLDDGTQAQVVHALSNGLQNVQEQQVQHQHQQVTHLTGVTVEAPHGHHGVTTLAEAAINSEGQLILTGDPSSLAAAGMVTIPVSMYQSVVTNLGIDVHGGGGDVTSTLGQQVIAGQLVSSSHIANQLSQGTLQVIAPHMTDDGTEDEENETETQEEIQDDIEEMKHDDIEDIKPLVSVSEAALEISQESSEEMSDDKSQMNGEVPDATQAVEVMSVDQS